MKRSICLLFGIAVANHNYEEAMENSKVNSEHRKWISEVKILFWNCGRNPVAKTVIEVARQFRVDIIILAEFRNIDLKQLSIDLQFSYVHNINGWIACLSRFDRPTFSPILDDVRHSAFTYSDPLSKKYLIVAVHLRSKVNAKDNLDSVVFSDFSRSLEDMENKHGTNTIVIGDFNADPFEDNFVMSDKLNAVPSRYLFQRLGDHRIVNRRKRLFFYNPMWSHLGDFQGRHGGTFFFMTGGGRSLYARMLDQVIMRPGVARLFTDNDLTLVDSVNGIKIFDPLNPGYSAISDHLPLIFNLRVEQADV